MQCSITKISKKSIVTHAYECHHLGARFLDIVYATEIKEDDIMQIIYFYLIEGKIKGYKAYIQSDDRIESISNAYPSAQYIEKELIERFELNIINIREPEIVYRNGISVVPFGPQHPMLAEPIKFWFELEDEVIKKATCETGYIFRDVEKQLIGMDKEEAMHAISKISFKSAAFNMLAFCNIYERIQEIQITERAQYFRNFICEICRIQAHIATISEISKSLGAIRLEEKVTYLWDRVEEAKKNISSYPLESFMVIGGLNENFKKETLLKSVVIINELKELVNEIIVKYTKHGIVKRKMQGIGIVDKKISKNDISGIPSRASGSNWDVRMFDSDNGYNNFKSSNKDNGDVLARTKLYLEEILCSISIIEEIAETLPEGEVFVESTKVQSGFDIDFLEESNGELFLYMQIDEKGNINAIHMRNSTKVNLYGLLKTLEENEFSHMPLIIASFGLDITGFDK